MAGTAPYRIKTITEFHRLRGLPKPQHPLISVVNYEDFHHQPGSSGNIVLDFYSISLKRNSHAKIRYGQQQYDFDEGILFFIAPGQVFGIEVPPDVTYRQSGWMLMIHPDFFWGTRLAKSIKQYEYFDYAVNEALFLSDKEEQTVIGIMQNILQEYKANIDKYSQDIIIAQIELLFSYSERFYNRQFITRKITNHQLLDRLEHILTDYFNDDNLVSKGLPSVLFIADSLNVSPNYLSNMLKVLTGQSTQQHIHDKLIDKAKEKLTTTELSVSEIAYDLGFEHPQSFSKLFKNKVKATPLQYRQSFN